MKYEIIVLFREFESLRPTLFCCGAGALKLFFLLLLAVVLTALGWGTWLGCDKFVAQVLLRDRHSQGIWWRLPHEYALPVTCRAEW